MSPLPPTNIERILMLPCAPRAKAILDELYTLLNRQTELREELTRLIVATTISDAPKPKPIRVRKEKTLLSVMGKKARRDKHPLEEIPEMPDVGYFPPPRLRGEIE